MDLSFTPEEEAFRQEVRAWLATAMPPALKAKADVDGHFEMPEMMEWHKTLAKKGWIAPNWPKEHGGPGWSPAQKFIFGEELEKAGTPQLSPFGLVMVGPVIQHFGTPEQKARFLPKILSGEEVWCQGYSEPDAGSDLAALRTTAVDDGNGNFIVNGQKTWTTYAQYADWIFCLVRTNPSVKKQAGITFLLIDMKTKGVEAKPMLTTGHTTAFCDTWFENAVVPKANVVGGIDNGWTVAKALLGHERTLIGSVGLSTRALLRVKKIASRTMKDGKPLLDDAGFRSKIGRLEIELEALRIQNYRAVAAGDMPGPESSILKIRGSEIQQQCYELGMEVMGHDSLSWFNGPGVVPAMEEAIAPSFNYLRATTIYGGSNEIQRNVIAKLILGLPSA
jgi:alkylation response protein AidB-like acyl-CoA dehydrogenase